MVLEFPPRESCSRRVSLEFLYGTCVLLPSTRAEMTLPSVDRDRLILVASFRRWPVAPVFPCLSDPCREARRRSERWSEEVWRRTTGETRDSRGLHPAPFEKICGMHNYLFFFFARIFFYYYYYYLLQDPPGEAFPCTRADFHLGLSHCAQW